MKCSLESDDVATLAGTRSEKKPVSMTPSLVKSSMLAICFGDGNVLLQVLIRRDSKLVYPSAICHASGRRLQSMWLANSHAQSLDPYQESVSCLSDFVFLFLLRKIST